MMAIHAPQLGRKDEAQRARCQEEFDRVGMVYRCKDCRVPLRPSERDYCQDCLPWNVGR